LYSLNIVVVTSTLLPCAPAAPIVVIAWEHEVQGTVGNFTRI
jgi:hypothetical protein